MATDADVLKTIVDAFAACPRPDQFYDNPTHCDECAEHDALLRSRALDELSIDDLGSPAWDPIPGVSDAAFAYLVPALARLALDPPHAKWGWYGPQLLTHLERDGRRNTRWAHCTPEQHDAVAALLEHIIDTRVELLERNFCDHQAFRVLEIWRERT